MKKIRCHVKTCKKAGVSYLSNLPGEVWDTVVCKEHAKVLVEQLTKKQ